MKADQMVRTIEVRDKRAQEFVNTYRVRRRPERLRLV